MRESLTRRDWIFLAICTATAAVSIFIVLRWFSSAFPEASIEFRYDRDTSTPLAARVLAAQAVATNGLRHTATFDDDDTAKIFLERSLGFDKASALTKRDVHLWYWRHRWFKPLQEEEYRVDVAPTGEIVAYARRIPEARALPSGSVDDARLVAERFLATAHVGLADLQLVATSERNLPHRVQRIFTWDSKTIRPANAPYRISVTVDGNVVSDYSQRVQVPEAWRRAYAELRSKNYLAGNVDTIFFGITIIAALVIFIVRLMRGDIPLKLIAGVGLAALVLRIGVALNTFPSALASYSTTSSYPAFLARYIIFNVIISAIGIAMFLVVLVGAGEPLYRERLPEQLSLSRIWSWRAMQSKRVFRALVLAWTLVAAFLGYQVAFYLVAARFGAWSPAEIPYDDIVNSVVPWISVLFAGFFPALSEEFMSRAFSIPFFERVLRSRVAAIVLAGFIWGFGHATYPNQPFFIRGVEVGIAGCVLGVLMYRFGVLPLVMWHFTIDAFYTALLLFRSGNRYYIVSAALSSFVFAIPLLVSIAMYVKNRGFVPDDDLTNAADGTAPPPAPRHERAADTALPPRELVTRGRVVACVIAVAIAALLLAKQPPSIDDAIDYKLPRDAAKAIATKHLRDVEHQPLPQRTIATERSGFGSWDRESSRQDGGGPTSFDDTAADYLVHNGMTIPQLTDVLRSRIPAGNWIVRFFTPLEKREYTIEVDPRTSRVLAYTKYQNETARGPRLDEAQALAIAKASMPRYGFDPNAFVMREALSFQQPNRRDWLFHFEEPRALAGDAHRRVSVRIAGGELAQIATTIKIPDSVYRDASTTTIFSVALTIAKTLGIISVLALIVAGFVIVARHSGFPWQRALGVTVVLSLIPLAGALADLDAVMFSYPTSQQWATFVSGAITDAVRTLGFQAGLLFLALVAIDAIAPYVFRLRTARDLQGRSAVVSAITAVAIFTSVRIALRWLAQQFPTRLSLGAPDISSAVAIHVPAFFETGEALLRMIQFPAAIALFAIAVRAFKPRWLAPLVTILTIFFMSLDASVTAAQAPLMLVSAAVLALAAYAIVRYVLRENPLAYALAIGLAMMLRNASTLFANHRPDLFWNGVAELAVAAIVLLAFSVQSRHARVA